MRWFLVLAATGCNGDGKDTTGETATPTTDTTPGTDGVCVSGEEWTGGDRESPLMHPGTDCIACHTAEREGPRFVVAGTVFTNWHEPDDCYGRPDVTVEITDAEGTVFEATTNAAGNFFLENPVADVVMPYTARILVNGVQTNVMADEQTDGSCGNCHTQHGRDGAPGRIVVGD